MKQYHYRLVLTGVLCITALIITTIVASELRNTTLTIRHEIVLPPRSSR